MKPVRHLMILVTIFMLFNVTNVYAKKKKPPPPVATLISQWSPSEQLTSIVGDTRTVELQMNVQTDRQFWAMDISCLVSQSGLFEGAALDQELTLSSAWVDGNDSVNHLVFDDGGVFYDELTNRINVVVTRVGASNQPVGLNGVSYNQLLFKLQLQVKEGLTGVINVSLTCDQMTLLDRNGDSLGDIELSGNNLILRDGYTLQGRIARQGNESISDVEVTCQVFDIDGNELGTPITAGILYDYVYDKKGRIKDQFEAGFLFDTDTNGGQPLRELGLYKCEFISKIDGTEETVYLKGTSYINLQTSSYALQPVTLLGGDVNGDGTIDVINDLPLITGPWGTEELTPFTGGDVNGDGTVNEIDLAIAAGNVGLSETDNGLMDHVIYSVARDFGGDFPNNSLSLGGIFAGNATQLNSDRAFWPQMSPDGSRLAYYTNTKTTVTIGKGKKARTEIVLTEGLVVADSNNYEGTVIAAGTNVAPSWSPSGNRIAYICTWDGGSDGLNGVVGYQYNNGNVCVIDANGGTPRVIDTYAEIFPPTWYDDTTLVYAGNSENTECPDRLCYYDMLTNTTGELVINGVDGTPNANMPVIVRYGADANYLFYRTFDGGTSGLNMATVVYNSSTDTWTGGIDLGLDADDTHQSVDTITGLHYYDVSPLLDVMYYEFGDTQFHNVFFDADTVTWSAGESHMVDGFIGYPRTINDGTNFVWDGLDEGLASPTDFHLFRPTLDWLP